MFRRSLVGPLLCLLPLAVSACDSAPTTSLQVTCNGQLSLAGAKTVTVRGDTLSFPDPANPGQTNTISASGQGCEIKPVIDTTDTPSKS